jgi:hypothetical protein
LIIREDEPPQLAWQRLGGKRADFVGFKADHA